MGRGEMRAEVAPAEIRSCWEVKEDCCVFLQSDRNHRAGSGRFLRRIRRDSANQKTENENICHVSSGLL